MLKLHEGGWLGSIPSGDDSDPRPFLLPGVRVRFLPIGRKAVRAAREAVAAALGGDADDMLSASDALTEELLRRGIVEWQGVGKEDGVEIPVFPAAIEAFLDDIDAFEAAQAIYVDPWARRDMEGNVSAGSPNGTGAAETPAKDTAPSPAPPTEADDAKSAPTAKTSRTPKKAKQSGAS